MSNGGRDESPVIGIDFDNTIACYDRVFHATAMRHGLIDADTRMAKSPIRDAIRQHPDGELHWQRLQAEVYGPLMPQAQLLEGVLAFLQRCRRNDFPVYVVSHKSEFARRDETQTNLRHAARSWMQERQLLDLDTTGLDAQRVFFEGTRSDKVMRIRQLACTHFIDDLPEVLLAPDFPPQVTRILLSARASASAGSSLAALHVAHNWDDVDRILFDA